MKTKVFLFMAILAILTSCKEEDVTNPNTKPQVPTGTTITYVNNTDYGVDIYNDGAFITTLVGMGSTKEYISTVHPISIVIKVHKGLFEEDETYKFNSYSFNPAYDYRLDINNSSAKISRY